MDKFACRSFAPDCICVAVALALAAPAMSAADEYKPAPAAKPASKAAAARASFVTPQAGAETLVAAHRRQDVAALQRLLGPTACA